MTKPQYASVYEFVDAIILPFYGTTEARINSVNWSARWWAHPEAVTRLHALWMRYETLRESEPATFLETFFRVHADYHMSVLMKDSGVFADCRTDDMPTVPLRAERIALEEKTP